MSDLTMSRLEGAMAVSNAALLFAARAEGVAAERKKLVELVEGMSRSHSTACERSGGAGPCCDMFAHNAALTDLLAQLKETA